MGSKSMALPGLHYRELIFLHIKTLLGLRSESSGGQNDIDFVCHTYTFRHRRSVDGGVNYHRKRSEHLDGPSETFMWWRHSTPWHCLFYCIQYVIYPSCLDHNLFHSQKVRFLKLKTYLILCAITLSLGCVQQLCFIYFNSFFFQAFDVLFA